MLIDFDFTKPQIKVAPAGAIIPIRTLPDGTPLFIKGFVLGDRPPLTKCARLQA